MLITILCTATGGEVLVIDASNKSSIWCQLMSLKLYEAHPSPTLQRAPHVSLSKHLYIVKKHDRDVSYRHGSPITRRLLTVARSGYFDSVGPLF